MRISVMGQSGSGKTTLAEKISNRLSIPHIHLDRLYFEAGGKDVRPDTDEEQQMKVRMRQKALAALDAESWVSDGFYSRILPEIGERADRIILLDIPMWHRLFNHAKRSINHSTRHRELSVWHDLAYFFEMMARTYTGREKINKLINKYRDKIVILKSLKSIDNYLDNLT